MTNSLPPLPSFDLDELRPFRDFDSMLTTIYNTDRFMPASIDYLIDDAHDDPFAYITSSSTFKSTNYPDANPDELLDESDFYSRINRDDPSIRISFRMIFEMIANELRDAIDESQRSLDLASSMIN